MKKIIKDLLIEAGKDGLPPDGLISILQRTHKLSKKYDFPEEYLRIIIECADYNLPLPEEITNIDPEFQKLCNEIKEYLDFLKEIE